MNPNDADVLAHSALCRALLGDGASGVELATKATRLNPVSGDWYIGPTTLSLFVMGRYEESIGFGARMPHATVDCPALLAAALALVGDRDRAATYLRRFLVDFEEKVTFGRAPDPGEQLQVAVARESFPAPGRHRALHDGTAACGFAGRP